MRIFSRLAKTRGARGTQHLSTTLIFAVLVAAAGLLGFASRTLAQVAQTGGRRSGSACPLCPDISDINLFRYCQSIVYFDSEISDRAFDLGGSTSCRGTPARLRMGNPKLIISTAIAIGAILSAGAATAADLAARPYTKAPITAPAAVYDWTGFYVGGNAGYGWQDDSAVTVTPADQVAAFLINSDPTTFTPC
jgi:hypothetical protein